MKEEKSGFFLFCEQNGYDPSVEDIMKVTDLSREKIEEIERGLKE